MKTSKKPVSLCREAPRDALGLCPPPLVRLAPRGGSSSNVPTDEEGDPVVWTRYLSPSGDRAWYVIGYDGERVFFGLVVADDARLEEFDRLELEATGAYVDLSWEPKRLSEVRHM